MKLEASSDEDRYTVNKANSEANSIIMSSEAMTDVVVVVLCLLWVRVRVSQPLSSFIYEDRTRIGSQTTPRPLFGYLRKTPNSDLTVLHYFHHLFHLYGQFYLILHQHDYDKNNDAAQFASCLNYLHKTTKCKL